MTVIIAKTARKERTKLYRGMEVDVRLDTKILDELNRIPGIKIINTCSGHTHPTYVGQYYYGNVPKVAFRISSSSPTSVCKKLRAMRDKKKANFRCDHDEPHKAVIIRGTKKGTPEWWREITDLLKRLYKR